MLRARSSLRVKTQERLSQSRPLDEIWDCTFSPKRKCKYGLEKGKMETFTSRSIQSRDPALSSFQVVPLAPGVLGYAAKNACCHHFCFCPQPCALRHPDGIEIGSQNSLGE